MHCIAQIKANLNVYLMIKVAIILYINNYIVDAVNI